MPRIKDRPQSSIYCYKIGNPHSRPCQSDGHALDYSTYSASCAECCRKSCNIPADSRCSNDIDFPLYVAGLEAVDIGNRDIIINRMKHLPGIWLKKEAQLVTSLRWNLRDMDPGAEPTPGRKVKVEMFLSWSVFTIFICKIPLLWAKDPPHCD